MSGAHLVRDDLDDIIRTVDVIRTQLRHRRGELEHTAVVASWCVPGEDDVVVGIEEGQRRGRLARPMILGHCEAIETLQMPSVSDNLAQERDSKADSVRAEQIVCLRFNLLPSLTVRGPLEVDGDDSVVVGVSERRVYRNGRELKPLGQPGARRGHGVSGERARRRDEFDLSRTDRHIRVPDAVTLAAVRHEKPKALRALRPRAGRQGGDDVEPTVNQAVH